jgi:hypothetical protein
VLELVSVTTISTVISDPVIFDTVNPITVAVVAEGTV